jgi:hypothetical protein
MLTPVQATTAGRAASKPAPDNAPSQEPSDSKSTGTNFSASGTS